MDFTTTVLERLYAQLGNEIALVDPGDEFLPGYHRGIRTARLYVLDELARHSALPVTIRKTTRESHLP